METEKKLIEGATLYKAKIAEAVSLNTEITGVTQEIERYQRQLEIENKKLESQMDPEEQEEVKEKTAEYTEKKKQLEKMYIASQEFSRLAEARDRKAYALDSKRAFFKERLRTLEGEKTSLERKTALLADSGCIDLNNASCRFLADAVEAKSILKDYPVKFQELEAEQVKAMEELEGQLREAEAEWDKVEFSQEALMQLQGECNILKPYEDRLKSLQEFEMQIALIRASIDNLQSNIGKAEERLATLKLKAEGIEKVKTEKQGSYFQHEHIMAEVESLKIWLEKEKQIPVAKERKGTAEKRLLELVKELAGIENEMQDRQKQAQEELEATNGAEILEEQLRQMKIDIDLITRKFNQNQIKIGGLKQKIDEIRRIKVAIEDIQRDINEMSEDAADYDALKLSFSQDGTPHQIIRTVLPKLSTTANNILSQMTGGQLGVDFVTEKVLKSNNKKEVVTLDIFIEEYGKSSLPYLSKSGGEKVKASLSVILALAETKASTAGIQFGMLFVDEPPFLDQDGIQAYCDALETIRDRYPNIKIMAITHDPTMKSRFPQNLDVVKTENGSKVIF